MLDWVPGFFVLLPVGPEGVESATAPANRSAHAVFADVIRSDGAVPQVGLVSRRPARGRS
ncbi:MAG: hypothetical protein ACTHWW_08945 [Arthrobacter sp.]|uniref:hypothetical protein n=1 Tax=Arthrobacter TaxID=1663 RepID=UPI002653F9DD|nr:hypothetical protein [Micrococcaceae bacterium]MDN5812325.1 hypothetical protein [Micrococcaceae bacterium]MDN5823594.1 hypothetical protein [Micrococcaceae bacterium]MDN5878406.1 hypothetical protein [Micrococcaceae bacterium]MDN5905055.1 hypothetical protein [Micrococcaceae bacterium]